jgi:GNAT superfamily N-acetyltransferase
MRKHISAHLTIRSLEWRDCRNAEENGLKATLQALAPTDLPDKCDELYRAAYNQHHNSFVLDWCGTIIGYGKLTIEVKLSHGGKTIAHIEDVSIHPAHQKQGYGLILMKFLVELAGSLPDCRRVKLRCKPDLIPFYVKCGFSNLGNVEMGKDL